MGNGNLQWTTDESLPAGKGARAQEFFATAGDYSLRIKVAPWGEGDLKINGRKISQVDDAKDRRQAFRQLAARAEQYLSEREANSSNLRLPAVKAKLLEGKRGQAPKHLSAGPCRTDR